MSSIKFAINKSFSYRLIGAIAGIGILGAGIAAGAAHSRSMYEPLGIAVDAPITAGYAVPVSLSLEGPAPVTIYSDPPGAVTYSGDVNSSSATVFAETSSDAPSGPIAVYVETDGASTVGTLASVQSSTSVPLAPMPSEAP